MQLVINAHTSGNGYWSDDIELITVIELKSEYISDEKDFMSLDAYFMTDNWKVCQRGLIYTDPLWLTEFREGLRTLYHFSEKAVASISYSEQGAQGDDYVNLDCGEAFVAEWIERNTDD